MVTVSRLAVTPVKGLALQEPGEIELGPAGVAENRRFYLVDRTGRLFSAPKHPKLVRIRPHYDAATEQLELTFPDGTRVAGTGIAGQEMVETDFYGRLATGRVVEGPLTAALREYTGRPVRLMRVDADGGACDVHTVTLLSDSSVEELRRRAGWAEPLDGRRFRMLLALAGTEPHEEDTWQEKALRVGGAVIRIRGPVPRCVLTTRAPETGERDFDTLRAIKGYRGLRDGKEIDFGVYADVVEPGRVRVGDRAELV